MTTFGRGFGYYLRAKRQQLGLSQSALSEKTKIQRTSISRLESSSGNPQWTLIRQIAEDGMGISVSELFQIEPQAVKQPMIYVEGQTPGPKLAEVMLRTQGKPIPVLGQDTPLRTKIVTDQDITGYCVLDGAMLQGLEDHALVIWRCPKGPGPDGHNTWLLVDLQDTALEDGHVYLIDTDKIMPWRVWHSPKGALILESPDDPEVRPVAYFGRQKDRVEGLGHVIMASRKLLP